MSSEPQPFDGEPRHLAGLMGLDGAADDLWTPDELGAILRHQLAAPVQYDLMLNRAEHDETTAQPAEGQALRGGTFGDVLHEARPSLELLEQIKQFAKQHHSRPNGSLPAPVARVVYYASIVAAMMRCGRRITRLDDQSLRQGLEWAVAEPWVDQQTRALLQSGLEFIDQSEGRSL